MALLLNAVDLRATQPRQRLLHNTDKTITNAISHDDDSATCTQCARTTTHDDDAATCTQCAYMTIHNNDAATCPHNNFISETDTLTLILNVTQPYHTHRQLASSNIVNEIM
ncbi:hypothetical protein BU15DRAFT_63905 [Melanogaster broomeanus]|nr:hypothetical protein BU15DRAFT_63905 [Melanogaster broomeanus]